MHIKDLRLQANMNQQELATKLGISCKTVSAYEKGRRTPNVNMIKKMAVELNVPVEQILECFTKRVNNTR